MNKLNEKVIRKLIKEEINSNKRYRHMSDQQKFMLEQGVVSKIAGAVKGVFKGIGAKIFGGKKVASGKPAATGGAAPAAQPNAEQKKQQMLKILNDLVAKIEAVSNQRSKVAQEKNQTIEQIEGILKSLGSDDNTIIYVRNQLSKVTIDRSGTDGLKTLINDINSTEVT